MAEDRKSAAPWEIWVGLFVAVGSMITIGWAIVETYWG
jgi:hypothetical protein